MHEHKNVVSPERLTEAEVSSMSDRLLYLNIIAATHVNRSESTSCTYTDH